MTRKEYEQIYGVKPVVSASSIPSTPDPIPMTRAEYEELYGAKKKPSYLDKVGTEFGAGLERAGNSFDIAKQRGDITVPIKAGTEFAGGLAQSAFSPLTPLLEPVMEPVVGAITETAERVSSYPAVQRFAETEAGKILARGAEITAGLSEVAGLAVPGFAGKTKLPSAVRASSDVANAVREKLAQTQNESLRKSIEKEIFNIENNYQKLRKGNEYELDAGAASRKRIAETDVLSRAVDTDGKLRTTQPGGAVDQYYKQTLEGREGVVRENLVRAGDKVNVNKIRTELYTALDKNFEGADLVQALKRVEREIEGLLLRADEFGNIPLEKVHDAKINVTKNINYKTDSTPLITYRKSLGNTYKRLVEDNSTAVVELNGKKNTVADINKELSKFYTDIERLRLLDGRNVKGSKLGKYFSQISGNLVGAMAGGAVGGPVGSAIGTIIGGEAAGFIKGRQMAGTFGRSTSRTAPPNPLLTAAKEAGQKQPVVDLRVPDVRVGAPKGLPKTKEILELEGRIAKNVEAQKKAIKANDFTLVATLKEIYRALVEKLTEVINVIKKQATKAERGFARMDMGQSKSEGNRNKQYSKTDTAKSASTVPNDTTPNDSFQGFTDLSTKLLEKLKGRTTVSKQFIEDLSNSPDLKQAERDLIRRVLNENFYGEGRTSVTPTRLGSLGSDESGVFNLPRKSSVTDSSIPYPKSVVKQPVYIGAPKDITEFKRVDNRDSLTFGEGIYLSPDKNIAQSYANGNRVVHEVFVDMKNPWYVERATEAERLDFFQMSTSAKKRAWLEKRGYDGVIDSGKDGGLNEMMVLDGSQIKKIPTSKSDQISVPDFANKVKSELLPLKRSPSVGGQHEGVTLSDELRGSVADYNEHIYNSPIKTSAGSTHYDDVGDMANNYFAHTRIEDLPDKGTRRVIELQSDLMQKGRIEQEIEQAKDAITREVSGAWEAEITSKYGVKMKDIQDYIRNCL